MRLFEEIVGPVGYRLPVVNHEWNPLSAEREVWRPGNGGGEFSLETRRGLEETGGYCSNLLRASELVRFLSQAVVHRLDANICRTTGVPKSLQTESLGLKGELWVLLLKMTVSSLWPSVFGFSQRPQFWHFGFTLDLPYISRIPRVRGERSKPWTELRRFQAQQKRGSRTRQRQRQGVTRKSRRPLRDEGSEN